MGKLTLIPTPLNPSHLLHPENISILSEAIKRENSIVLIEDAKATRSRWTSWGLPREYIEKLIEFNEHTQEKLTSHIIKKLKKNFDVYLISDEGMPAFCDPGTKLVDECHLNNITVGSGVFENSLILALALSGFDTARFKFSGFPPKDKPSRKVWFQRFIEESDCVCLMDTAYRLERVLSEVKEADSGTRRNTYLVASELNRPSEKIMRGSITKLLKYFAGSKRDFILVKSPHGNIGASKK